MEGQTEHLATGAPPRAGPEVVPDLGQTRQHEPRDVRLSGLVLVWTPPATHDADFEACRQAVEPRLARSGVEVDQPTVRDVRSGDGRCEVGQVEEVCQERVELV